MDRNQIFATIDQIVSTLDDVSDSVPIRFDDTSFKAYGLTSLQQMELAVLVEDEFGIKISDSDAFAATSVVRLVDLIERKVAPAAEKPVPRNLLREIHATLLGTDSGITFLDPDAGDVTISYRGFLRMSAWLGQKLPMGEPDRPRTLVIAASNPLPTLLAFFAALGLGARPLIIPGPKALGGVAPFVERMTHTLSRFPGYCALALEHGLISDEVRLPDVPVIPLSPVSTDYGESDVDAIVAELSAGGDDVAFLQMTSASTGAGKLVAISHANACANLTALGEGLAFGPGDRIGSWLPLYHDMGLVGTTLCGFFHGLPLGIMKPTDFIRRPYRWLDMLSRLGSTITAAPNFGYDYAARTVSDRQIKDIDLSRLRCAVIGAEPIRLATLRGFVDRFAPCGLRAEVLTCSYGMAEATLGTAMLRPGNAPRYLLVDVAKVDIGAPVRILGGGELGSGTAADDEGPGVAVFSNGPALPAITIELVDEDGAPLSGDGVLGEFALRGPSVSVGYFDSVTAAPVSFADGVFRTGDLGFVQDGDVFILERSKHVIIRNGQNFLASLLEARIAQLLDRPEHELIVLDTDVRDPRSHIIAVVENFAGVAQLTTEQKAALRDLDLPIDAVLFSRKRIIPRTTSGKKKYHETRRRLAARIRPGSQEIRLKE